MADLSFTIRSVALNNERYIWLRRPMHPATARQLVMFLDAEWYREKVEADRIIDELGDEIADAWFVFVSMHSAKARCLESPCHRPFAEFIVAELLPEVERRHPELRAIKRRTIAGLSYTGLAAAFIAREFPGVFRNVISQSGSFWWNDGWLAKRYAELPDALPTAFHLSVGLRETQENLRHKNDVVQTISQIEGVRRFRDALRDMGHDVTYVEFDGAHDFAEWKRSLPDALRWALPTSCRSQIRCD